jgi:hypothetical protein
LNQIEKDFMSDFLTSIASRLFIKAFAPRPTVKCEGALLIIESGWRTAFWTFGARKRRASIDRKNEIIRIQDRRFWFFVDRQVISFDRIQEIIYNYGDMLDSNWVSHSSEDLYRVGLWLKDGKSIILFRFYGEGEFINNSIFPDWMMMDEILPGEIVQHNMDAKSLTIADVLSQLVGVPIGNGPL